MDLTEDAARSVLAEACERVGLGASHAKLIRLGSNAVFHIRSDVIGRVSATGSIESAERQVKIARWLDSIRYPVNKALAVAQPVQSEGGVVTFWESVGDGTVYAPIADVAAVIRRLHDLTEFPTGIDVPELCPLGEVRSPLPRFDDIDDKDAKFLRSRIEWGREEFPKLPFALSPGLIHGDANVGNVLSGTDGRPIVIDLDNFAFGAREWDLIQTAMFYDRYGWHTREEYETFVDVYGYDLMKWSGYSTLADIRETAMVMWLSKKAGESRSTAAEAAKRIQSIRTGSSRRDWGPY